MKFKNENLCSYGRVYVLDYFFAGSSDFLSTGNLMLKTTQEVTALNRFRGAGGQNLLPLDIVSCFQYLCYAKITVS